MDGVIGDSRREGVRGGMKEGGEGGRGGGREGGREGGGSVVTMTKAKTERRCALRHFEVMFHAAW